MSKRHAFLFIFWAYVISLSAQTQPVSSSSVSGVWDTRFSIPQIEVAIFQAEFWKGDWYLLGSFSPRTESFLMWSEKEQAWKSIGGITNEAISKIHILDDGLYVTGTFQNLVGIPEADYIARWDGTKWNAVIPNLKLAPQILSGKEFLSINTLYKSQDGKLYVGGMFLNANDQEKADHAFIYDGQQIQTLSNTASLNGQVSKIIAFKNELIFVGDFTDFISDENDYAMRFDGTHWKDLNLGSNTKPVEAAVFQEKLFITGNNNNLRNGLWIWDDTSKAPSLDSPFKVATKIQVYQDQLFVFGNTDGLGITQGVVSVAKFGGNKWSALFANAACTQRLLTSHTRIVTSGCFIAQNGSSQEGYASLEGSFSSKLPYKTVLNGIGLSRSKDPNNYSPIVNNLTVIGNEVHVGGNFSHAPYNTSVSGLMRWSGNSWKYFSPTSQPWFPSKFYNFLGRTWTLTEWGGTSWDGNSWRWDAKPKENGRDALQHPFYKVNSVHNDIFHFVEGNIPGCFQDYCIPCLTKISTFDGVQIKTLFEDKINLCARYKAMLKTDDAYIFVAELSSNFQGTLGITATSNTNSSVISFDGKNFRLLTDQLYMEPWIRTFHLRNIVKHDSDTYFIGRFDIKGLPEASNIARWDGTKWHALGTGLVGTVKAILFHETGIYAGGDFVKTGDGVVVNGLARFDGTSWRPVGGGVDPAINRADQFKDSLSSVEALAAIENDIFVGGRFNYTGDVAATGFNIYHILSPSSIQSTLTKNLDTFQIYPNPIKAAANIILRLRKASEKMSIKVYDLLGRQQIIVYEGLAQAQTIHTFPLNTQRLASGVYLCTIEAESFSITKRFVVMHQ